MIATKAGLRVSLPALTLAVMAGIQCKSPTEPVRQHTGEATSKAGSSTPEAVPESGPTAAAGTSGATRDAAPPPEVRCHPTTTSDGRIVVRYEIRNLGTETIHLFGERRMPYQLARDERTLVILHGLNIPDPDTIYAISTIPPTRPLTPGGIVTGEAVLGQKVLRNHFDGQLAPQSLQHGTIHVRCDVGWGLTPITEGKRMTMDEFIRWQRLTTYGPIDVVLP